MMSRDTSGCRCGVRAYRGYIAQFQDSYTQRPATGASYVSHRCFVDKYCSRDAHRERRRICVFYRGAQVRGVYFAVRGRTCTFCDRPERQHVFLLETRTTPTCLRSGGRELPKGTISIYALSVRPPSQCERPRARARCFCCFFALSCKAYRIARCVCSVRVVPRPMSCTISRVHAGRLRIDWPASSPLHPSMR